MMSIQPGPGQYDFTKKLTDDPHNNALVSFKSIQPRLQMNHDIERTVTKSTMVMSHDKQERLA